jgi:hypothetical protein
MRQRSSERSDGVDESEASQDLSIDIATKAPEPEHSRKEMRDCYSADGHLHAVSESDQGR